METTRCPKRRFTACWSGNALGRKNRPRIMRQTGRGSKVHSGGESQGKLKARRGGSKVRKRTEVQGQQIGTGYSHRLKGRERGCGLGDRKGRSGLPSHAQRS